MQNLEHDINSRLWSITNDFFHISPQLRQQNPWWIAITLFLAKENRLEVKDDTVLVDYSGDGSLKDIILGACPEYPLIELEAGFNDKAHVYSSLARIAKEITQWGGDWLKENFSSIYSAIFDRITALEGIKSGEYVQPKELTQLAVSMLQYKGGSIYNPFAGLCSYGIAIKGAEFFSQEISERTYNLARFNMLASGVDYNNLHREDSFTRPLKSDYLITTPPFGLRNFSSEYRTSEAFVLDLLSNSTNKRGIVILPYGILHRTELISLRRQLIAQDILDSIIALPTAIMQNTAISLVMLVTDKNKANPGEVKMINLTHCYHKGRGTNILDTEKAFSILANPDSAHITYVNNADIDAAEYDLRLSRYIQQKIRVPDGYTLKPLRDLLTQIRLQRNTEAISLPAISVNDSYAFETEISALDGKPSNMRPINMSIVSQDCLLINPNGRMIRSAWFDSSEGAAQVPAHYLAFTLNTGSIDKSYLTLELGKPYVAEQLGGSQIHYTLADILRLRILVPSLERQRDDIIKAQKEYIQESGIQLHELQSKQHQDFVRAMRTRKHAIGQVMNQVLPGVNTIVNFIKDHPYKDDVVGLRSGKTLGEYAIALQHNILRMSEMINQFTKEISFPEAEEICIEDVALEYIKDRISEKYILELDSDAANESHQVMIAKSSLVQMLDNICDNALRSGFTDRQMLEDRAYRIRISCYVDSEDSSKIRIIVANNGQPLSEKVSPESVFAWGEGERTGIGGYEIATIAQHYGGSVEIKRYDNDLAGFTVGYEIVLPSASKVDYE